MTHKFASTSWTNGPPTIQTGQYYPMAAGCACLSFVGTSIFFITTQIMRRIGFNGLTTLRQYGPVLRSHRKEMAKSLGTPASLKKYVGLEELETRRLLYRLLEAPDKLTDCIRTSVRSWVLFTLFKITDNTIWRIGQPERSY